MSPLLNQVPKNFSTRILSDMEARHDLDEVTQAILDSISKKPYLEVDAAPLIEYLASKCVVSVPPELGASYNDPKAMIRCDDVIPWPLQVGWTWKPESTTPEQRKEDWENFQKKELLKTFAIYLLNNWVPFGFFLKETQHKEYKINRPEGIQTSSEYVQAELEKIKTQEAP